MKKSHFLAALLLIATSAFAQAPFLVTDLNSTTAKNPESSSPEWAAEINGRIVLAATTRAAGKEVWQVSNGSATLLADINPGTGQGVFGNFYRSANGLLFTGRESTSFELWRTDGTAAGTMRVKKIHPTGDSVAAPHASSGTKVIFTADDGVHGQEPWITDGTEEGTKMLVDLDGTSASSRLTRVVVAGDRFYLFARNSIWVSNGTPEGTVRLNVSVAMDGPSAAMGTTAYFGVSGFAGLELWKCDGTDAGTVLVKDALPGSRDGLERMSNMVVMGGMLYFVARDTFGAPAHLWKTDGTTGGTEIVKSAVSEGRTYLSVASGLLYVTTSSGTVLRSDGTPAGTYQLPISGAGSGPVIVAFSRGFIITRAAGAAVDELWSTDGTAAGTSRVVAVAGMDYLINAGGKLYFGATSSLHGNEPWVSDDGTAAGTHELVNIEPDSVPASTPEGLTAAGDLVYFMAWDGLFATRQLFRSDGTAAGTFRLTSFNNQGSDPLLTLFTGWKSSFFFRDSWALWRSDGTVSGTQRLWQTPPGSGPNVKELFGGTAYLYLDAADSTWRSDGTETGTIDLSKGLEDHEQPQKPDGFAELGGRTYTMSLGPLSPGIFNVNSSPADTKRVTYFRPIAGTTRLVSAAGALFFARTTPEAGMELWRSDGTNDGTAMVKDIAPGSASSSPAAITAAGPYAYFLAANAAGATDLWRSDGTPAGTILLRAGTVTAPIEQLTGSGELLYFVTTDASHGTELWCSDGTVANTRLVGDIWSGTSSSMPANLVDADGTLYFRADDGVHGPELWKSVNGATPELIADVEPGGGGSSPQFMTRAGALLYFSTFTTAFGRELWALPLTSSATAISIRDGVVTEGNSGTRTMSFVCVREGDTSGSSSVSFTTGDGTAAAGADYLAQSGTLSFGPGETAKSINVVVNGDTAIENNETFFVTLTGATGAAIRRNRGAGLIEDDDHRVDLRVEWITPDYRSSDRREFRVTNAGASTATNVQFRYSESPYLYSIEIAASVTGAANLSWSARNAPFVVNLHPLAPGESTVVSATTRSTVGVIDPAMPPGRTVTASVTSSETDEQPNDNTASKMVSTWGTLILPPFLTSGTSASGTALVDPATASQTYTLTSSSPNVTVSPSTFVIPPGQTTAQFTLTSGAQSGTTVLTLSAPGVPPAKVVVPVVATGVTAMLDVAIAAPDVTVEYGATATIVAQVAAVRHDGTRPTGTLSLVDAGGAVLATQTLVDSAATFQRSGLAPGTHDFTWRYSGDGIFSPAANVPVVVTVTPWKTSITLEAPPMLCAGTPTDAPIYVRNLVTEVAPTGVVAVTIGGSTTRLTLAATGVAGESRVVLRRAFTTAEESIRIVYEPTSQFASGSSIAVSRVANCLQMNFVATANGNTVSMTWTPVAGAARYGVEYVSSNRQLTWAGVESVGTTAAHIAAGDGVYLYTVRAMDATGATIGYAMPDLASTIVAANTSRQIRRSDFMELQHAAWRLGNLIRENSIGEGAVPVGAPIRAADIEPLRAKLNAGRTALGLAPVAFTPIARGAVIRGQHIEEMRNTVR